MLGMWFLGKPGAVFHHLGKLVFGREIGFLAFRRSTLCPARQKFELLGRQCLVIAEIAESFDGAPWRHAPFEDFLFDGGPPRECIFVFGHGECHAAFTMTGDAARIEDAGYFLIPRYRRGDDVVRLGGDAERKDDNENTNWKLEVGNWKLLGTLFPAISNFQFPTSNRLLFRRIRLR